MAHQWEPALTWCQYKGYCTMAIPLAPIVILVGDDNLLLDLSGSPPPCPCMRPHPIGSTLFPGLSIIEAGAGVEAKVDDVVSGLVRAITYHL